MYKPRLRFRRTTIIAFGLTGFLAGLGFARLKILLPAGVVLLVMLVCVVTIRRKGFLAILTVVLLGFVFGWWRGQVYMRRLLPITQLDGRHVVATVRADSDATYDDRQQLSFNASQLHVAEPKDIKLPGSLLIAGFGEPAIYKGDMVRIEGKLYKSRGSHVMGMSFADMQVLGRSASPIDNLRRKFAAGMETALPEPAASFGLGLLIGQRSTLPEHVTKSLSTVGLTHIIAVSGYNLTIIMDGIRRLLGRRSKYQVTVLSLLLMLLFLLMTGLSASIVRAAIVSTLGLMAWYYGRTFRPIVLILLAASLTAGWNPTYLWSDIGWYLSFMAFYGVLVVAPLVNLRLLRTDRPRALTGLFVESVCALIMTIPIVLYIFGQLSLIAIIANLLVVPFVPLAMLLTLAAGVTGMLFSGLAGLVALPAK